MARYIALARSLPLRLAPEDLLRALAVYGCALALILAKTWQPF